MTEEILEKLKDKYDDYEFGYVKKAFDRLNKELVNIPDVPSKRTEYLLTRQSANKAFKKIIREEMSFFDASYVDPLSDELSYENEILKEMNLEDSIFYDEKAKTDYLWALSENYSRQISVLENYGWSRENLHSEIFDTAAQDLNLQAREFTIYAMTTGENNYLAFQAPQGAVLCIHETMFQGFDLGDISAVFNLDAEQVAKVTNGIINLANGNGKFDFERAFDGNGDTAFTTKSASFQDLIDALEPAAVKKVGSAKNLAIKYNKNLTYSDYKELISPKLISYNELVERAAALGIDYAGLELKNTQDRDSDFAGVELDALKKNYDEAALLLKNHYNGRPISDTDIRLMKKWLLEVKEKPEASLMIKSQVEGWQDWPVSDLPDDVRKAAEWLVLNGHENDTAVKRVFYDRQTSHMADNISDAEAADNAAIIRAAINKGMDAEQELKKNADDEEVAAIIKEFDTSILPGMSEQDYLDFCRDNEIEALPFEKFVAQQREAFVKAAQPETSEANKEDTSEDDDVLEQKPQAQRPLIINGKNAAYYEKALANNARQLEDLEAQKDSLGYAYVSKKKYLDSTRERLQRSLDEFKPKVEDGEKPKYINTKAYEKFCPLPLRKRNQFVCWKEEWDPEKNKWKKEPINARTGGKAMSNNPTTWSDFDTACKAVDKYGCAGIGVMFGKGLMGIDIDDCVSDGRITPEARDIISKVKSYTEYSVSGKGIHILVFGDLPPGGRRKGNVEIYSEGRFFTLTGNLYQGQFIKMSKKDDAQAGIDDVHKTYFKSDKKPTEAAPTLKRTELKLSEQEIVKKVEATQWGKELYSGNGWGSNPRLCEKGRPDNTRADIALVGKIAYFTQDRAMIDRVFRSSALMREKWDEIHGSQSYGNMTIDAALAGLYKTYDGKKPNNAANDDFKKQPYKYKTPKAPTKTDVME